MKSLDNAIIRTYIEFDTPVDEIVADPELAAKFQKKVVRRLPPHEYLEIPLVNKRLLNLRKLGEEKGGLPRIRREYNGRGPRKTK